MVTKIPKIEIDFCDRNLTGKGGLAFLGRVARHVDLLGDLERLPALKRRARGVSDARRTWTLIASLACGNGALSDLDALGWDRAACALLGVQWRDPDARRTGEHLARFGPSDVEELRAVGRKVAGWIAPAVIERWVAELGYVPLFVDGSQIEVQGRNFEGAAKDYKGDVSFQLGAAFLGELQVSGRLGPGNADAAGPWREQLERDVEPLLEGVPVWGRMDNAYYRQEVVEHFEERGWDYSISVTSATYKSPILEAVDEVLEEADWEPINDSERAAFVTYSSRKWRRERTYVVVRRDEENGCRLLFPIYTVILVSRDDLPLKELVARHRAKQGQENAFKGPLTEMNLHHPRCAALCANQAYYECALIAQLLVRAIQYKLLPEASRECGLGYVMRHVMRTVGMLVRSGGRLRLDFARSNWQLAWLWYAADRLA